MGILGVFSGVFSGVLSIYQPCQIIDFARLTQSDHARASDVTPLVQVPDSRRNTSHTTRGYGGGTADFPTASVSAPQGLRLSLAHHISNYRLYDRHSRAYCYPAAETVPVIDTSFPTQKHTTMQHHEMIVDNALNVATTAKKERNHGITSYVCRTAVQVYCDPRLIPPGCTHGALRLCSEFATKR